MKEMFKGVSILEFQARFPDDNSCKDYLLKIKWPESYCCNKCGHLKYCDTSRYGERRCTKCRSVESATANTLFHKVKFPLLKAFYIVFFVSTNPKGMSSYELARKLGMHQPVVWRFKRKMASAMVSSGNHLIDGEVHVDETFIGGKTPKKKGRSQSAKKQAVIAIQKHPKGGISRAYAQVIPNAGYKSLKPFIEKHISVEADLITDKWRGYTPLLKNTAYKLTQINSDTGNSFPEIHRFIMMLKGWLRGIHHSVKHLQVYLDEYTYRYNRHKWKNTIFHNLVKRMVTHEPVKYKDFEIAT